MRLKTIVCFLLLPSFCSAIAETSTANYLKNFEVSVGVGSSWVGANNGTMQSTSTETDTAITNNYNAPSVTEKIGVGYHLFSDTLAQRKYFNDLLLELNVYHVNNTINGQVAQYQDSALNNYTFQAPLKSTSIMFDIKPSLFTIDHVSPYPIVGAGFAWNKLSYNETPSSTVPGDSYKNLASGLNRKIAYDAGAGIRYNVNQHLNASLEYLYHYSGNLSSSSAVTAGSAPSLSGASFVTHSQNILFNIGWRF